MIQSPKSQRLTLRKKKLQTCNAKVSPGVVFSDTDDEEITESLDKTLNVVDVCSNRELFETFKKELKSKRFLSVCLACDKYVKVSFAHNVFYRKNALGLIGFFSSENSTKRAKYWSKNYSKS